MINLACVEQTIADGTNPPIDSEGRKFLIFKQGSQTEKSVFVELESLLFTFCADYIMLDNESIESTGEFMAGQLELHGVFLLLALLQLASVLLRNCHQRWCKCILLTSCFSISCLLLPFELRPHATYPVIIFGASSLLVYLFSSLMNI
uniref:Uncharacterized protein n=1 Tax=Echinococcus canadensis TaxID=519352 RepID=A0A915EYN0_9CEST